jgi:hypothetical protein
LLTFLEVAHSERDSDSATFIASSRNAPAYLILCSHNNELNK